MIIALSNGKQLRGDIIKSAVIRSDMAPIPLTLEAEIRVDTDLKNLLAEGKTITAAGDEFRIIKSVVNNDRASRAVHPDSTIHIIALLSACYSVAFVRDKSIIKENSSLLEIYRAAGATIKAVDADFSVPKFNCYIGQVPSFYIAQKLQEEGGAVRWKNGKLQFFRVADLFKQKTVINIADNVDENVVSEFLERHEVPQFYSLNDDGSFLYGNNTKARSVRFAPQKNALRLQNMTACLIKRKVSKVNFSAKLAAGDLVNILGAKPLVIVTAAHVFTSGSDGDGSSQYTRLWLYGLSK